MYFNTLLNVLLIINLWKIVSIFFFFYHYYKMYYLLNFYEYLLEIFFIEINDFYWENFYNINNQEIWELNINVSKLELKKNLPWNLYYKYKLSLFFTWHVLEDRISIFIIIFIYLL